MEDNKIKTGINMIDENTDGVPVASFTVSNENRVIVGNGSSAKRLIEISSEMHDESVKIIVDSMDDEIRAMEEVEEQLKERGNRVVASPMGHIPSFLAEKLELATMYGVGGGKGPSGAPKMNRQQRRAFERKMKKMSGK